MSTIIQQIKDRLDIIELIGKDVTLRRSGRAYTGFCPFHDNKKTPAFVVWPDRGIWKCFGACNESGDLFDYVIKKNNWDFREALEQLARLAGVELPAQAPPTSEQVDQSTRLHELLELAGKYYHQQLQQAPQAAAARQYLQKRGLTPETIQRFEIGYALDSWDAAQTFLQARNFTAAELLAVGLTVQKDDGRSFDRFRNRILFPIRDGKGQLVGFGARALHPNDQPKYLNSPTTELFDKSHLLYGLFLARTTIRKQQQAVLVEGYMDVCIAHQAGFENVICPMGTALSEQQLRDVKKLTPKLVLALDSDAAGAKAILRSLDIARQSAAPVPTDYHFDPHGLLRDEARLQLDIRVADLPPGLDPDELILQSPEQWQQRIATAPAIVDYLISTLLHGQNLTDSKVKRDLTETLIPIINDVGNQVERSAYLQKLAVALQLDERVLLRELLPQPPSTPGKRRPNLSNQPVPPPVNQQSEDTDPAEQYCLAGLYQHPELLAQIDRRLRELGLAAFGSHDFAQPQHRQLFNLLLEALQQTDLLPKDYLSVQMVEQAIPVLPFIPRYTSDLTRAWELDVLRVALRLRERNIAAWLHELHFLQADALTAGTDPTLTHLYQQEIVAQVQANQRIQRALRPAAIGLTRT